MDYQDESQRLYVGRELTPEEFARWFAAQELGRLPFNAVGIHHTYRPDGKAWRGLPSLNNLYDYYHDHRGWRPWGRGPHLWLYCGDGAHRPGERLVYVGTHPRHDGFGIASRNRRWLHIEAIGNYDSDQMPPEMVELYRRVLRVACGERVPLVNCRPGQDNPSRPLGLMFHRDEPGQSKSCPGRQVDDSFFAAMREDGAAPAPPLFRDCGRAAGVPRLLARPAVLVPGANVRAGASTESAVLLAGAQTDVRVLGFDAGQEVAGSPVWYLLRVGYLSRGVRDTLGYAHSSAVRLPMGGPLEGSEQGASLPRLCVAPAQLLDGCNARAGASTASQVLGVGPHPDLEVLGWQPGRAVGGDSLWYLARLGAGGRLGYVHASVLHARDPEEDQALRRATG